MLSTDDRTTRTAYDALAQDYAETFPDLSAEAPGDRVLLAFQCGRGERLDRETAFGRPVRRTNYRHSADAVANLLEGAGVTVTTTVVRPPAAEHETTPQAFVLGVRRT